MSILIKDMEMPKDIEPGLVIEFANGIDGKRYARLYHYRHGGLTEWLEAVPVPPHGDLVDRDEMREIAISLLNEAVTDQEANAIRDMWLHLGQMPVYIPADPGEEETT